ncbi:hypothetical protein AB9M93_16190 [Peribacillus frigoritolerans]|uniref:hypothetical protein n=1 Tax=Peribacillus frigoritolerans TaxID=450367 RepID=UPI003516F7A8
MKDKLVLNRVRDVKTAVFSFKTQVDWSGCARLLREKRVQGDPTGVKAPRRLPDRPLKASAWSGNQRCDEGDALGKLVPEHHLVLQLSISRR